jgi:hypothetical protein
VEPVSVSVVIGLSKEVEQAIVGHWSATVGLNPRICATDREWLGEVSSDSLNTRFYTRSTCRVRGRRVSSPEPQWVNSRERRRTGVSRGPGRA